MIASSADARLDEARQRFFTGRSLPTGLVGDAILKSWQRCADHGLDAGDLQKIESLTAGELRDLQQRNELLRQLVRPEIAVLRSEAKLTDSVVIITDARGAVLDAVGSVEFAGQASAVALRPGVVWSEDSTGTNAIGTALVERRPIAVRGAEHFFEPHRMLTCAAVPIFDPRGRLAGVLDMSGHASVQHVHALGLVRLAVEQIEHRFFLRGFDSCTVLRFHRDRELVGTQREGILVFDEGKLVGGNRRGMRLLGLDRQAFDRSRMDDLFESFEDRRDLTQIRARSGETFAVAADAVVPPTVVRGFDLHQAAGPYFVNETKTALARAVRLANAEIPLLVQGETGTGKEVFAREVHRLSQRSNAPFIAINCAALPEGIIESELFGYTGGAFTGADKQGHKGLIRQAEGGVLFLDEIGDMPLALQSRLLRVLQDREVVPLGGGKPTRVDFLPICASHRPLKRLVEDGLFRNDLYFRLAQYVIDLPPLRTMDGKGRIVRSLWRQLGGDRAGVHLSAEAEETLLAYPWPGNFRQLSGRLKTLIALAEPGSVVEAAELDDELSAAVTPISDKTLESMSEEAMRGALAAAGGNVSKAARELGIDRSTLYRRLLWKNPGSTSRH